MSSAANQPASVPGNARRFEILCLGGIVFLGLALRLWRLDQNGWGAEYYTTAVRSMSMDWHNFFYTAFDPLGFISVDKPPVALWLQVAFVKLLGFYPLSVLLPQVIEGVGAVVILFYIVKPRFGVGAGLLSALFFAVTPIWVAVNRTNNMDSCLLFVLLLAAWALLQATEFGSRRRLFAAMALVGIAFNVKMLAAYIVLPTFALIYFIGAPLMFRRRLLDLVLGGIVVAAVSLPWVLTYELTPAEQRPYVGSSTQNSMLELLVGHNGIGRFVSRLKRPDASAAPNEGAASAIVAADSRAPMTVRRLFVRTPTGPWRLLDGQAAAQFAWLLPFAIVALVGGVATVRLQRPFSPAQLMLFFWLCWIATYVIVYSYAGGIMHFYYLSTLAPPLAALAGVGVVALWNEWRQRGRWSLLLPVVLLLTSVWQLYVDAHALGWDFGRFASLANDGPHWLHLILVVCSLAAVGLLVCQRVIARETSAFGTFAAVLSLAALLVVPMAWTLSSVLLPAQGVLPSADLYRAWGDLAESDKRALARFGKSADLSMLVDFLQTHRKEEKFILSTSTTQWAAPIIIDKGEAVMARGGFHGLDAAMTPETLARMVAAGEIRFAMLGDIATISRRMGADAAGKPVADWIRANGKLVDPSLWNSAFNRNAMELYDLRPST